MKKAQGVIAGLLYAFMTIVIMALFMPTVRETIDDHLADYINITNGGLITLIITFYPMILIILFLIVVVIILRN